MPEDPDVQVIFFSTPRQCTARAAGRQQGILLNMARNTVSLTMRLGHTPEDPDANVIFFSTP
ncbi:hypothetical protein MJO29_005847 [Puccinia striiformis f. sp. tritici]|nr:hypothetical protein MJO29_005847 [Puccinia striiformis f. sp. tritici]